MPLSQPAPLYHRDLDLSTGFPLWLKFLNKRPLRAEASTTQGVGFSPSLAQAPALATGPALTQEERKSPISGEKPGRAGTAAKHHALSGGSVVEAHTLPEGHSYPTALRKLLPWGETWAPAKAGQETGR